jgi:transposase
MPRAGSHTRHLTTDERQRVRTLYFDAHYSPTQIAAITGYKVSQIRYSCRAASAAVAVRSGRPPVLDEDEKERLISYIRGSKKGRQASYLKLSRVVFNGSYGHSAIRNTLRRLGYKRYVARRKPPISEKNRLFRL